MLYIVYIMTFVALTIFLGTRFIIKLAFGVQENIILTYHWRPSQFTYSKTLLNYHLMLKKTPLHSQYHNLYMIYH